MPFVSSSFLLLVVVPGATSSFLLLVGSSLLLFVSIGLSPREADFYGVRTSMQWLSERWCAVRPCKAVKLLFFVVFSFPGSQVTKLHRPLAQM